MMVNQPTLILTTLLSSISLAATPMPAADVSIIDTYANAALSMKESAITTPAPLFVEEEEVVVIDVPTATTATNTWWNELIMSVEKTTADIQASVSTNILSFEKTTADIQASVSNNLRQLKKELILNVKKTNEKVGKTTADIQASVSTKLHQVKKELILNVKKTTEKIGKTTADIQASVCKKLHHHEVNTDILNNMLRCPKPEEPSKIQLYVNQIVDWSSYTACAIRIATDGIVKKTMAGDHWITIIGSMLSWVYFIVGLPLRGGMCMLYQFYMAADLLHHLFGWVAVGLLVFFQVFYCILDFPQARTAQDVIAHIGQFRAGEWRINQKIRAIFSQLDGGDVESPLRANYVLFGLRFWNYFHAGAMKKSYRAYSLKYHPDKYNPATCDGLTREEAMALFQTISQAYKVAKDSAIRGL